MGVVSAGSYGCATLKPGQVDKESGLTVRAIMTEVYPYRDWISRLQAYKLGGYSTNVCPDESSDITDIATCEIAASALFGLSDVHETKDEGFPKHCFVADTGDGKVAFYNSHQTGSNHSAISKPICTVATTP